MVWLGVHTMTQTEGDATTGRVHSPTGAVFAKLNANDKEHAKHTSAVSELIRHRDSVAQYSKCNSCPISRLAAMRPAKPKAMFDSVEVFTSKKGWFIFCKKCRQEFGLLEVNHIQAGEGICV